ncbi:hypothetical protein CSR02_01135 [Acetobacter pomorum]|uniref:Mobilization protein n=1 Tax=Acetobacter pomorum TaxID=65959 RepID=A0A2G4RFP0_9PROT|nr:hypothetical protein [Acetobacter pomorum]PHY95368.1 hypothetical protein CSR02_01135 [Acetobacter pomorum]GBR53782.1 hypothetical protein AA11825_2524 [Acetobacter pomorum DSM 11825]
MTDHKLSEVDKLQAELEAQEKRTAELKKQLAEAHRERACNIGEALLDLAEGHDRWKLIVGEIASRHMKPRKSAAFKKEASLFEDHAQREREKKKDASQDHSMPGSL